MVILLMTSLMSSGCATGPFHLQYLWKKDEGLSYYVDKASAITYPTEVDVAETDPDLFREPRGIRSLEEGTPREITLNECIRLALANTAVIRDDGSFGSPANPILQQPSRVASIYDPAIQQTGFLFGNRGYEAALADFDALFTTNATWGRDEVPQNVANLGIAPGGILVSETMNWSTTLEKTFANGSQVQLSGTTNYDGNNRTGPGTQRFQSHYNGLVQAQLTVPLLAGSGTEFNRIAGPQSQNLRGVSGVSQGILISRINGDIALTQFEQQVATLIRDVEQRYWDLSLFLRLYESEKEAFETLVQYYKKLKDRDVSSVHTLQAQGQIHQADARIRGSLVDVLDAEARLRRLVHLPLTDDEFLYPVDAPSEARLEPLWSATLQDALANRIELRRQKWEIKSLELQSKAANSLVRPRLDFVSQGRINGLGDHLLGDHDFPNETLGGDIFDSNTTGWSAGIQLSMPVGLRLARTQARNYELQLRKARAVLSEQEREIAFELSNSIMGMERWYEIAESTVPRIGTAAKHVETVEVILDGNPEAPPELFGQLLQAKVNQRDAMQAYTRSIIEYNKAITDLKFRKGTLLTDNEVYLAEGNWHPAAAPFAMQRAVRRTMGHDRHKLKTEPMQFVGGYGPAAYESLNTNTRPTYPEGMKSLDAETNGPNQAVPNVPSPDQPMPSPDSQRFLEPAPVPPAEMEMPPQQPVDPQPAPQPPRGDDITEATRALRQSLRIGGGDTEQPQSEDVTGRVKL